MSDSFKIQLSISCNQLFLTEVQPLCERFVKGGFSLTRLVAGNGYADLVIYKVATYINAYF
jgi:hypothetical protein